MQRHIPRPKHGRWVYCAFDGYILHISRIKGIFIISRLNLQSQSAHYSVYAKVGDSEKAWSNQRPFLLTHKKKHERVNRFICTRFLYSLNTTEMQDFMYESSVASCRVVSCRVSLALWLKRRYLNCYRKRYMI